MFLRFNTASSTERYFVVATGLLALLLSITSTALADVVSPPPTDCPEGARGITSHAGPLCTAIRCDGDAGPCEQNHSCEAVEYCVEEVTNVGWSTTIIEAVIGFCNKNEPCERGTCQTLQVCVSEGFAKDSGAAPEDASSSTADTGTTNPADASSSTADTGTTNPADANSSTTDAKTTNPTDASSSTADAKTTNPTDASGANRDVGETTHKDATSTTTRSDTEPDRSNDASGATDQELDDGSSETKKTSTFGCGCVVGKGSSTNHRLAIVLLISLLYWRLKRRY